MQSPLEGHSISERERCSIDSAHRISPKMIRYSRQVSSDMRFCETPSAKSKANYNCNTFTTSLEEQAITSAIAISVTPLLKLLKPVVEVELSNLSASDSQKILSTAEVSGFDIGISTDKKSPKMSLVTS